MIVAKGIFMWDREERQTDRYGSFFLTDSTYDGNATAKAHTNLDHLENLVGRRVRVTVQVVKSRVSGHVGDLFRCIKPIRPEPGEVVDLGVGELRLKTVAHTDKETGIVLKPGDGRERDWIDPRKLYRLHDQTVEVHVEETSEDFSPAPVFAPTTGGGVKAVEDVGSGMSIQTKGVKESEISIEPKIEKLGDGLFAFSPQGFPGAGENVAFRKKG